MSDTVKLATCACGGYAMQMQRMEDYRFTTACGTCDAQTPHFPTQALADAAWNRMMVEPLHELAPRCGPPEDARALLSALADELGQRAIRLKQYAAPYIAVPVTETEYAIRAVLAKKP